MGEIKEIYPVAKLDRRIFPHIPREGSSARRLGGDRFLGGVHIDVYRTGHDHRIWFSSYTEDISNGGTLIMPDQPVAEINPGDTVFLRFDLTEGVLPEGYESRVNVQATVARVDDDGRIGLSFAEPLDTLLRRNRWRFFEWAGMILIVLTLAAIVYIRMDSIFYFLFDIPVFLYGICASLFLVSRFFFALFYKNVPIDPEYTPSVTIIIPCYNEEQFITRTIRCALDQDYPPDKLQVIVVDDGSVDNSVAEIRRFKEETKHLIDDDRFTIVVQPQNGGKRKVMATGTLATESEMVVFVDSDSFLEPDAVRQLVQPLRDPAIGAVCGRCEVENKWTNFITKMQAVRYYIAFQVFKGAESVFDAVTCLSGPLACYRRTLVMKHLDAWLHQTYFGRPATFGDDRSLTNFILNELRVVYQHDAVCSTIVPSSTRVFLKQQMRWKRSWLRESLRAAKFMWRTEPFMAISFYAGLLLPVLAPFVVIRSLVVIPLIYGEWPIVFILGLLLMSMLISSTYLILKRSRLWIYGALFCFFYLGVLMWQMIPAIITFWVSDWGTRGPNQKKEQPDGEAHETSEGMNTGGSHV